MRWIVRVLKAVFRGLWSITRVSEYGQESLSDEKLAAAEATQQRAIAEVSANPTDRLLAQALLRSADLPFGFREVWRSWSPLDPTTPIVTSVQQSLAAGSWSKRHPSSQILLDLRRYISEEEAATAIETPPDRVLTDGGRMRQRVSSVGADVRVYEWSRRDGAEVAERVVELRLQRETALAVLLGQAFEPGPDWDRQLLALIRDVGSRLR